MIIYSNIENLLHYAKTHLMLDELDTIYVRNQILTDLKLQDYTEYEVDEDTIEAMNAPDAVINPIVEYAVAGGIITESDRDRFAAHLMDRVSLRPSQIADLFNAAHERSPHKAFDFLHDYCIRNYYIKQSRIAQNKHWEAKATAGKIEITINVSRPEKNNADTAAQLKKKSSAYPECMICIENEGHYGAARENLRTVPMVLNGEDWFWQFSPYAYFNQHGIAVNNEHVPMKVDADTFAKLIDFVDLAPMYFIGCNAALPRVGGSILTHDHFQGGYKLMPSMKAKVKTPLKSAAYPYIDIGIVDWYNSVLRLSGSSRELIIELAALVNDAWNEYSDESVGILAKTDEQHNAVTPIVRKVDDTYIVDIILRNNRTDESEPGGIYHAHKEYHHIKSEAIGLIEAMGLFILPGRLDADMKEIEKFLTKEVKYARASLADHLVRYADMIEKLMKENPKCTVLEAQLNIKDEVSRVCERILDNTAVFKRDEAGYAAFIRFVESMGLTVQ